MSRTARHVLLVLASLISTLPLYAADPPVLAGATHVGIHGRLDIVFSADAGRTFSKPAVVVDSPLDDRNPAFGQAADGALVVAFWRAAKDTFKDYETDRPDQPVSTHVTRSTDGGRTWSDPAE